MSPERKKTQCNHVRMFSVLTSVVCYFAFLGADVFSGTFDLLQYTRMVNIFPAMGVSLVSTHLFFAFFNHKDHRFSSAFSSAIDAFLPMLLCLLIFAVTAEFISLLPGISNFHELMLFLIKKPFELRQHRTTTIKQISDTKRWQIGWILPVPVRTGRTRSDCRAKPVSQNQVRQREQHIQFGGLFSQTPVSRFSIPELPLYDRKYVLYLCPDR